MKTIIYAGIGLFSVAAAYGIADYYTEQKKGTFRTLYHEEAEATIKEKQPQPEVVKTDTNGATAVKIKNPPPPPPPTFTKEKRTLELEDYSRGKINDRVPMVRKRDTTRLTKVGNDEKVESDVEEEVDVKK